MQSAPTDKLLKPPRGGGKSKKKSSFCSAERCLRSLSRQIPASQRNFLKEIWFYWQARQAPILASPTRSTSAIKAGVLHLFPLMAATDTTTTLAELKSRIAAFARERDWEQFHAPKNLSMAVAAEAAELMEHFLWSTPEQSQAIVRDPVKRGKIEEEIADVVIYALEFANVTGIDLAAAIEAKMAANARKYPVQKARGRADKYDEL
jgi:dCTP diphosphatase